MIIFFDTQSLYYLPQYLPIEKELRKRNIEPKFIFYKSKYDNETQQIIDEHKLSFIWVNDQHEAIEIYEKNNADWVFFANTFSYLDRLHQTSKTAQIGHGIGPKSSYYKKSDQEMSVRFVEGQYRLERLQSMYPKSTFLDVGFCKLDPVFNNEKVDNEIKSTKIDSEKKTILYAPTFYPSSLELFPKNWPEDFKNYNILIKPHYFSISKSRYERHRCMLKEWESFSNVYVAKAEDFSVIPFFDKADILISDASSVLFEFAVLDKPVIWCDFLKLRWSYRGIFKYRFKRRMDKDYGEYARIAVHAKKYSDVKELVQQQLRNPKSLSSTRKLMAEKLAGKTDGKASARIVDYILKNK